MKFPFLFPTRQRLDGALAKLQAAQDDLRLADAIFDSVQAVLVANSHGVIERINTAFTELTGYTSDEVLGKTPWLLRSGHHDEAFYAAMRQSIGQTGRWQGEIWDRHKSGVVFPKWMTISAVTNAQGALTHLVATYVDMSERKRAEEQIHQLAFYDVLTGLPNRALLRERVQQALGTSARHGHQGVLLHIDLDGFKRINDSLGYPQGDRLLQQVGPRLQTWVQEGDTVARVGGNEFAVLLGDVCQGSHGPACQIGHVAEHVLQSLKQPYALEGGDWRCTASLGLVVFSGEAVAVDTLLQQAELAMHQAKTEGRNRVHFFDPALEATARQRVQIERELDQALAQGHLVLFYQPQVALDGSIHGVEALVRWQHPERGLVGPGAFIPLAEETGQILPLGRWVLQTACAQLAAWCDDPLRAGWVMAVNVSARQFVQPDFVQEVADLLRTSGIDPGQLKLELTESLMVAQPDAVVEKMHALKALGLKLSLDDFGTGYSSLSYLQRMPFDQIKIDQSFVCGMPHDAGAVAIARSSVALAQGLGLQVVAEGVESLAQREALAALGCAIFQGYYYSRPLPLAELEGWQAPQTE